MTMNKYSQSSPPAGFGAVTTGPAKPSPSGGDTGTAYQTPSKYPSGVYGRPTAEEKEKVIMMQSALNYFSNSIREDQAKLIKDLGVTDKDINKWSQALVSTGGRYSFDGKWASKTSNALKAINEIIAKAKEKNIYNGGTVVAPHNYQSDGAVDIMRDADANIEKITALANALRVGGKYFGKKDEVDNTILDMVPKDYLLDSNVNRLTGGSVPVRESNLVSLYNFHYFLNHYYPDMSALGKGASTQDKLKKLARHIVNTDIIREAQDYNVWKDPAKVDEMIARPNYDPNPMATGLNLPGKGHQLDWARNPKRVHNDERKIVEYNKPQQSAPAAVQPAQQKPVQQAPGLNINELEAALQWFWKRSKAVEFAVTNPAEGEQIDRAKLSKARLYVAYVTRLYQQFNAWKKSNSGPGITTLPGGPEERRSDEMGASKPKPGGGSPEGHEFPVGGEANDVVEKLRRPPLRELINLENLAKEYNINIRSYAYAFQHSWLDINGLKGAYAPNIYNELIRKTTQEYWRRLADQESYQAGQQGKNGTNVYAYLKQTLNAVSLTLSEVFSNWSNKVMKSDQPRDAVEKIIRQQKGMLNEWISVIQRVNDDIDNLIAYNRGRFGLK